MKISLFKKGFTLIELLVVIAIIGILTAIVTANFTTAKSKARDAKRVSDIAQLQLVLEQYFDKKSAYPTTINITDLGPYISAIPTNNGSPYTYTTEYPYYDYVLSVQLENNSSVLVDSVKGNPLNVNCSATNYYCVQPK